jgi:hypothetical protein
MIYKWRELVRVVMKEDWGRGIERVGMMGSGAGKSGVGDI